MSKTKKYNRKRRKNKTNKSRLLRGGTIKHNEGNNIFVRKNNSDSNREQEKFFNIVLPQYLGIPSNNANALIQYLKERGLSNLAGNKRTPNGHDVAIITSPKILKALIGIIKERNEELLTSGDPDSSKKLQSVITSLQIQNAERSTDSDDGHSAYHDNIMKLEQSVSALMGAQEVAGKSSRQSIDDSVSEQLSAFAMPFVSSGSSGSKGCSSAVVRLPKSVLGMVIGKKGKNIKQIQNDTNTNITNTTVDNFVDFTIKCRNNAAYSNVERAREILGSYNSVTFNVCYTSRKAIIEELKRGLARDSNTNINVSNTPMNLGGSCNLEISVTIIGRPDAIKYASDRIRKINKQAQANQGRKTQSSAVGIGAFMKTTSVSKSNKKSKEESISVDSSLHDPLVAEIENIKSMHNASLIVGDVDGSNKITITIQGSKKARKKALTYLRNKFGNKLRGGKKTRKKRKNKRRNKNRRKHKTRRKRKTH